MIITVTNTNDSGPGSLRDAVNTASSGDTIIFDIDGTINLSVPILIIDKSLTILGPGPRIAGSFDRIFNISGSNHVVTIAYLELINGYDQTGEGGGAIINDESTLNIFNCFFAYNTSAGGGAIANRNSGTLNIDRSIFFNNSATRGGAILNLNGTLNISNSSFYNNIAPLGDGGAIENSDGTIIIKNNLFYGNSASQNGGGIITTGTATLICNIFYFNTATSGGAIANVPPGSIQLENNTLIRNSIPAISGIFNDI